MNYEIENVYGIEKDFPQLYDKIDYGIGGYGMYYMDEKFELLWDMYDLNGQLSEIKNKITGERWTYNLKEGFDDEYENVKKVLVNHLKNKGLL